MAFGIINRTTKDPVSVWKYELLQKYDLKNANAVERLKVLREKKE